MTRRPDAHHCGTTEFHSRNAWTRRRIQRDGEIEITRQQCVEQFFRMARLDLQRHIGERLPERLYSLRDQPQAEARQTADPQMTFRLQRKVARQITNAVEVVLQ